MAKVTKVSLSTMLLVLLASLLWAGLVAWFAVKLWTGSHKEAESGRLAGGPKLYRQDNNGVIAVVRVEDHKESYNDPSRGACSLVVVPNTMIFCADDHRYPVNINDRRTGNLDDYRRLAEGCIVENRADIFVPFSSFVWGSEWQYQKFRRISMEEAMNMVYGNK